MRRWRGIPPIPSTVAAQAPDARDEAVAAAQRTATGLERDYLDGGDGGPQMDLRDLPTFPRTRTTTTTTRRTTAAVAGTNLTREILHESRTTCNCCRALQASHGRTRYDPGARTRTTRFEIPGRRDGQGNRGVALRRGGEAGHTRRRGGGHDGAHGLVTATRASRGAEARVAARAAVAAREVYAAAGLPYPPHARNLTYDEGLGFGRLTGSRGSLPGHLPRTRASIPRAPRTTAGRLLARRLVERERLVRAAGDGDEDDRGVTAGDATATVAPSPPSLLPPPIDEAGLGEMDERDLRAALMDTARRLEAAQDELLCQICFTERRDALIMPCLHLLYCRRCVDRSSEANERRGLPDRCPCCRASVGGVLRCKRL